MITNLSEKYIEKYSKLEFLSIISFLSPMKLREPIIKSPKNFRKETSGFRIETLSIKKLQEIYFHGIYTSKNMILASNVENLVHEYLKKIDQDISEKLGTVETIRNRIEGNDMECFEQLINILLNHKFVNNISLYFKIIDFELNDEQTNYLNIELKKKIEYQKLENQVKKQLGEQHEIRVRTIEEDHKQLINEKELRILQLEKQIDYIVSEMKVELSEKDKKIYGINTQIKQLKFNHSIEAEKHKRLLNELQLLLLNKEDELSEKNNKINYLNSLLEDKFNEFNKVANERWLQTSKKLLAEKHLIETEIEELNCRKERINDENVNLVNQKLELEEELQFIKNEAGEFLDKLKYLIATLGSHDNSGDTHNKLFEYSKLPIGVEIEEVNKLSDFLGNLSENLAMSGISSDYAIDLANYIYATFSNKMCLLLIGYNARGIADAVSYTINGTSAGRLILPLGYNNSNELILKISESKNKVILIENAIESLSESVYMPLLKQNIDKYFIFSMESSEHISIMPESILNYMMLVDLDILLDFENISNSFNYGIVNQEVFNKKTDNTSIRHNLRHLKDLNNVLKLKNVAKYKFAEIMSIIDKLKSQNAMYDIVLFSLILLCKFNGKLSELTEFIDLQDFNPILLKVLQSNLGDSAAYE